MNIYLMVYLIGAGLKTFFVFLDVLANNSKTSASQAFSEVVLWPWYFVIDMFFGIMSIFGD